MKIRIMMVVLVVAALAFGARAVLRTSLEPADLVPAWQLVAQGRYSGENTTEPFASWSPDSKSLAFSEHHTSARKNLVFLWKVGARRVDLLAEGLSPNFLEDSASLIYLKTIPPDVAKPLITNVGIFQRDLTAGRETEILPGIKKSKFWKDISALDYDSKRKIVTMHMSEYTRRRNPAGEQYDLTGKHLGEILSENEPPVVDSAADCTGSKCALILQDEEGKPSTLEIADRGQQRGKPVAAGDIGAAAWSPDGKLLAYGQSADVEILFADSKRLTVGRFGISAGGPLDPYVARLLWSPNGQYLAALVVTPDPITDHPAIYVLDMSKLRARR